MTSCNLPLYEPLAHVNFESNLLTVIVKLNEGETLGEAEQSEGPIVWAKGKKIIMYKIPVIAAKALADEKVVVPEKELITEDDNLHCTEIKLEAISDIGRTKLVGETVGVMAYISKPKSTLLKSEGEDDDDRTGTVIVWDNGTLPR